MLWLILLTTTLGIIYWMVKKSHRYWKDRGVKQGNPVFLFGHVLDMFLRQKSVPEVNEKLYNIDSNARYVGVYTFTTPHLLIRDPDLIKQITIKDFDHFIDHRGFVPENSDSIFDKFLLNVRGQKWRELRSAVSPTFTSSKMKFMFHLMSQGGKQFIDHYLKKDEKIVEVEMKSVVTKYTNDVIANTVFGYECNSFEDESNDFYRHGKEAVNFFSFRIIAVFLGYMVVPKIFKFFKVSLFSEAMREFFFKVVKENIKNREDNGIIRPDMITLLLELRKHKKREEIATLPDTGFATVEESSVKKDDNHLEITDDIITSQAFTFFFAGFDMIASVICFMAHELAVNPDVQKRLVEEVDETRKKCNDKITYEAITTMKYMDMVVSETLRKFPTAIASDRRCTKPYTIQPERPDEKPLHLEKEDLLLIPIHGIHRDPQYYPDPEKFDPERFSDENKHNIKPGTYLPFGAGPRSCIGSRYALLKTKIFVYFLLSHFELVPVEKTQIPLKFSKKAANMSPDKGFWLGLQKREV